MCSGGGSKPSAPKFKDPRAKDPEYLTVAGELGFKNKKGAPKIKNQKQLYEVQKVLDKRKETEYQEKLDVMEQTRVEERREDVQRVEQQYQQTNQIQQEQFVQSIAAQDRALQAQLAAQADMQRRSEEAALRAQVPQFTANASNARRVRAKGSSKQRARQASMGAGQLRVPLGISQGGGGSPVKLNIGS